MDRFFNTAGPCVEGYHHMLPPEGRVPGLMLRIERAQYFVLHAPRQTGKSTTMYALAATLRGQGYVAMTSSIEAAGWVNDVAHAEAVIIDSIGEDARQLPEEARPPSRATVDATAPGKRVGAWLAPWSEAVAPRRIVLLLDEVDGLKPEPLLSLLSQLRAGYNARLDGGFPFSIGLIGLRDLRDYMVTLKGGVSPGPTSPFNIKVESFTLSNFTEVEVAELYAQHTADTGQIFTPEAVSRAYYWSRGQPYIVNALAERCVDKLVPDRAAPILSEHIDAVAEHLVRARVTHLDNLAERLREPRVATILQAVLLGNNTGEFDTTTDDFRYVLDLGLLTKGPTGPAPANPMYAEVLVRQLTMSIQDTLPAPWWRWHRDDGTLDFPALIDEFRTWWRRNADMMKTAWAVGYPEAVPQLVFMGFLQRVVNGGGTVEREYALGRGRIDLVVTYAGVRHAVELKRVAPERVALDSVIEEGSVQLAGYLDALGVSEGWLLVFDQRQGRTWEERMWRREVEVAGKRLHLFGG